MPLTLFLLVIICSGFFVLIRLRYVARIQRLQFELHESQEQYRKLVSSLHDEGIDAEPDGRFSFISNKTAVIEEELQRTREQVEAAQGQQRAILEFLPIGVGVISGREQRLGYYNSRFEELFGHKGSELDSMEEWLLRAYPDPEYRRQVADEWLQRLAALTTEQRTIEPMEVVVTTSDGKEKFVSVHATALGDDEYVISFIDLSDRKRHEGELSTSRDAAEEANRIKSMFLATMTHELRTPLNAIIGLSGMLQEAIMGEVTAEQARSLSTIEQSGRHLLRVITDILELTQIEAGRLELMTAETRFDEICHVCLHSVREQAQRKQITVSLALPQTLDVMYTDPRRLKQVLLKLLDNAVKFTPEGGQIGLEVFNDVSARQVGCTVWDTGIGIAPEDQKKLFQPFVQVDSRLARQYEGSGLGLVLAARLAKLMGGGVTVSSESEQGSRFTVTLPWGEQS